MIKLFLQIALTLIFYFVVTSVALVLRIFNIDLIKKNINPKAETYWENYTVSSGNLLRSIKKVDSRNL